MLQMQEDHQSFQRNYIKKQGSRKDQENNVRDLLQKATGNIPFSGFRKQSQEEFYDILTCKLIELLVGKMISTPAMREVLLISMKPKQPAPASDMPIWAKKVAKIFRTMKFLEKKKLTKPLVSPNFAPLIDCLKTGAYAGMMEF